jgi:hypothetical protein
MPKCRNCLTLLATSDQVSLQQSVNEYCRSDVSALIIKWPPPPLHIGSDVPAPPQATPCLLQGRKLSI